MNVNSPLYGSLIIVSFMYTKRNTVIRFIVGFSLLSGPAQSTLLIYQKKKMVLN